MTLHASSSPSTPATVVAVNLAGAAVGAGWGKARVVAIARVADGAIVDWTEHEVAWDVAHDTGTEGSHHARIVRFLREQGVQVVVTGHLGAPMQNTLTKLGCRVVLGLTGDARAAAIEASTPGAPAAQLPVPAPTSRPGGTGLRSDVTIDRHPGRG
jgi:predicted Fe-Mo cluster-binding NifX family protein